MIAGPLFGGVRGRLVARHTTGFEPIDHERSQTYAQAMSTQGAADGQQAEFEWQVRPQSPVISVFPWGFGWTAGCEWDKPPWGKWDKWPFKGVTEWHGFGDDANTPLDNGAIFPVTQYVYTGLGNGRFVSFSDGSTRWEDVATIWHRLVSAPKASARQGSPAPTGNQYVYTVVLTDGRTVNFSGFRNVWRNWKLETKDLQPVPGKTTRIEIEQLGRLLEQGVIRTQLPKAMDLIRAGQTMSFGQVSVSQRGVDVGKHSLAWSQVKNAQVGAGSSLLKVKQAGKLLPLMEHMDEVPNYFLFVALVRAMRLEHGQL